MPRCTGDGIVPRQKGSPCLMRCVLWSTCCWYIEVSKSQACDETTSPYAQCGHTICSFARVRVNASKQIFKKLFPQMFFAKADQSMACSYMPNAGWNFLVRRGKLWRTEPDLAPHGLPRHVICSGVFPALSWKYTCTYASCTPNETKDTSIVHRFSRYHGRLARKKCWGKCTLVAMVRLPDDFNRLNLFLPA